MKNTKWHTCFIHKNNMVNHKIKQRSDWLMKIVGKFRISRIYIKRQSKDDIEVCQL